MMSVTQTREVTYVDPSGRMILRVMWSMTWSSKTWSTNFITKAYLSPTPHSHRTLKTTQN